MPMAVDAAKSDSLSLAVLREQLEACAEQGLSDTHPLKFYYLQALLDNLSSRPHLSQPVIQRLLSKASVMIADYQAEQFPVLHSEQGPGECSDRTDGLSNLKSLNTELQQRTGMVRTTTTMSSHSSSDANSEVKSDRNPSKPASELQALKHYQQLFEKMAVERLLTKVMQEIPENAGPLNPERVVIRCLSSLQAISPAYVMRLMGYYESLISLQSLPIGEK